MENKPVNHGFLTPVKKDTDYIFGAGQVSLAQPLQLNLDWSDYLPADEDQNLRGIETYNCTAFATSNQIEAYMKRKFGITANYSDRFIGLVAGTKKPGNDPNVVYEAIRKYGLVPEEMCPFSDDIKTIDEYFSWKGVDKEACLAEGKKWLAQYKFYHDWVANGQDVVVPIMRTALQYSILCGAFYAWAINDKGVYVRLGSDNHWSSIYKIGDYVENFDSYDPNRKDVSLDFGFKFVKRIHIEVNTEPLQISLISRALALISQVIALIFPTKPIEAPVSVVNLPPVKPKPPEPIDLPKKSLLEPFCLAITQYENMALSYYNPGALRFSSYIQSLGATSERAGFAVFPNMATGEKALRSFVKAASENRLKAYHDKDILGFFQVYAPSSDNNKPELYAKFVAGKVGVEVNTKLKDII